MKLFPVSSFSFPASVKKFRWKMLLSPSNRHWYLLLYSLLFSGLGVFSFLLLANYANLTPQVTNVIHTPCAFFFVVATFNILGYYTLRISSWINRLYSNKLHCKWKFIVVYTSVMLLFLLLIMGCC